MQWQLSTNGGASWTDIATDPAGKGPHSDDHAVAFDAGGNLIDQILQKQRAEAAREAGVVAPDSTWSPVALGDLDARHLSWTDFS